MFRLIRLQADHGIPHLGVDEDAYASECAALARCGTAPARFFGAGRFDYEGTLAEVVMHTACGPSGDCPGPASVVDAHTFQRLCDACAADLEVLTVRELSRRLGIAVRAAPVPAGSVGHAASDFAYTSGNRIAEEFAARVDDPTWRAELCAELDRTPTAINGLLIGVGALSHRDVLDRYPELCTLGDQLPGVVRAYLVRARVRPLSPGGVAARRLGL